MFLWAGVGSTWMQRIECCGCCWRGKFGRYWPTWLCLCSISSSKGTSIERWVLCCLQLRLQAYYVIVSSGALNILLCFSSYMDRNCFTHCWNTSPADSAAGSIVTQWLCSRRMWKPLENLRGYGMKCESCSGNRNCVKDNSLISHPYSSTCTKP